MRNDRLVERGEVVVRFLEHQGCGAVAGRGVHHGGIELRVVGLELDQQIQHFIVNAHGIGARPVDLVDHDDRSPPKGKSLAEYEAGLRHGAVEGVDHQKDAINHP